MKLTIPQLYVYNKVVEIAKIKFDIQDNEVINYLDNIIKKIKYTNSQLTWDERINIAIDKILNDKKNIPFVIEI